MLKTGYSIPIKKPTAQTLNTDLMNKITLTYSKALHQDSTFQSCELVVE